MGPCRSLTYLDNIALSIRLVSPSHFLLERGMSVIVATKRKLGLLFSRLYKVSRNGASSGRRLEQNKYNLWGSRSWSACFTMLKKGVIPIPPARSTAGFAEFLCSVKEPIACSTFTEVPSGTVFKYRLNAVSRMRVANIS